MRVYLREAQLTYRRTDRIPEDLRRPIRNSADVARVVRPRIGDRITESFLSVALDAKNRILGYHEVARGSTSACPVIPSDTFRYPLITGASSIILAHNHPSGQSAPSDEDVAMTRKLREAGQLLGLPVLDHLIVTVDGYYSFLDAGLLGA